MTTGRLLTRTLASSSSAVDGEGGIVVDGAADPLPSTNESVSPPASRVGVAVELLGLSAVSWGPSASSARAPVPRVQGKRLKNRSPTARQLKYRIYVASLLPMKSCPS